MSRTFLVFFFSFMALSDSSPVLLQVCLSWPFSEEGIFVERLTMTYEAFMSKEAPN